jgi:hypothetical protein
VKTRTTLSDSFKFIHSKRPMAYRQRKFAVKGSGKNNIDVPEVVFHAA